MKPQNKHAKLLRIKLIEKFGGVCERCKGDGSKDGVTRPLEFAHKIGFRFPQGRSRGSNKRVLEVNKYPERFHLFCFWCHRKYDKENKLTKKEMKKFIEYEEERQLREVPF